MHRLAPSLLLLVAIPAAATVIHVPAEAPSIQAGLDLATPGDTVEVACGDYYEHDIVMPAGVTLRSEAGHWGCVTIDAQQQGRVIFCADADASTTIEGFTLQNGLTEISERGGGILCMSASPRIDNCQILFCDAGWGNGIALLAGSDATIANCWIRFNQSPGSGGAIGIGSSSPNVDHCSFEGNFGWDGGAIWISGASEPVISNCLFLQNQAQFWGGAIGAQTEDCRPTVSHCTFFQNGAGWDGGNIWVAADAVVSVENSILAFALEGGGIHIYEDTHQDSDVLLTCSDVFANTGGNFTGEMLDVTGIDGNISEHPRFCNSNPMDLFLAADSPCLPENNDCEVLMGAFGLGCDIATGVEDPAPAFELTLRAAPNPFNPKTRFHFVLAKNGPVNLTVHAVDGRRVATLLDGTSLRAGAQTIDWRADGLAAGCYLARVEAAGRIATTRLILLK